MAHIIVGLSGGVDSSLSAALLLEQGHTVSGLFMKNWEEDDSDSYCSTEADLSDAQAVCTHLGIPLEIANFSATYWEKVFTPFLKEYQRGHTPNPDVLCNQYIKFDAFLKRALSLGADYIATGHYARIHSHPSDKTLRLHRAADPDKDQSYFLYRINQEALTHTLFPLHSLTKKEVRILAKERGLPIYGKKDSVGICFIGKRPFKDFLSRYIPKVFGPMTDPNGTLLGTHQGLAFYTLGQRQGLEIGGLKEHPGAPWYVVAKDVDNNRLILSQDRYHPLAFSKSALLNDVCWINTYHLPQPHRLYQIQSRYRQKPFNGFFEDSADGVLQIHFQEPQRDVTPGQSLVIYEGDCCLGGGICASTIS
jgi:tRNA-uridine 2-sulfurtransferase